MSLSPQDCADLTAEIIRLLSDYDPQVLEPISRSVERYEDPRRNLVELLGGVRRVYSERSGGTYGPILDRINHFVRLEDGQPIRGLSVVLTPAEQEVFGRSEVNLAELPDRSEFLAQLDLLIADVKHEVGFNW